MKQVAVAPTLLLFVLQLAGCGEAEREGRSPPAIVGFVDRAADAGLDCVNHTGARDEKPYLIDSKGGGILVLDYDGDGDLDIYQVDGNSFRVDQEGNLLTRRANPKAGNRLMRNEGGWRFVDVTEAAGVGDTSFGIAGAVGDYDNDGDSDLFVCNWGRNILYRNNGDSTFTDVSEEAGVAGEAQLVSTCAAFFDSDADGDLDLYVSNYGDIEALLRLAKAEVPGVFVNGIWRYSGPGGYPQQADLFYRNLGGGRFRDESEESLKDQRPSWGFQPLPFDADNDGDLDIFVANDSMENFLWVNDGTGHFTEQGMTAGVAVNGNASRQSGMGVDAADYDQDGWIDLVVTNFAEDRNTIYRNLTSEGILFFEDATIARRLGNTCYDKVSWGVGFRDFDLDGVLDLFVASGHVYPTPDNRRFMGGAYRVRPNLYFGSGPPDWRFTDATAKSGPGLSVKRAGRAAAFGDFDRDGDEDICVACLNDVPLLLENRLPDLGHWLRIGLVGERSNRDGIGARVTVTWDGDHRQMHEHHLAASFGSSLDDRMVWGLGAAAIADRVVVKWPSGVQQEFQNLRANRTYVITEDRDDLLVIEPSTRRETRSGRSAE